jgi:UDP-2,3-diacylglucosamine pyrophosphatase LpxH
LIPGLCHGDRLCTRLFVYQLIADKVSRLFVYQLIADKISRLFVYQLIADKVSRLYVYQLIAEKVLRRFGDLAPVQLDDGRQLAAAERRF